MTKEKHIVKGILCMLFAVTVWGGWVVVSRVGVKGHLTPYDIAAIRFTVAGLLLSPVALRVRFRVGPWGIIGGVILMMLMGAPYNLMTISAFQYVPASHCSIIYAFTTSITCILSYFLLKEQFSRAKLAGILLGVLGIVAFLMAAKGQVDGARVWFGHLLLMIAGSTWGVYAVLSKKWRAAPLENTSVMAALSMILYLPIFYFFLPSHLHEAPMGEIVWQGFYQGILTNILALLAYNKGVELLGASGSAAFIPLVPVMATLAAVPFLHEVPTLLEVMGILLAAAGVMLATGTFDRLIPKQILGLRRKAKPPTNITPV
ncbi:MAG: DMT family transporter [Proteobacteria bacterium]|nr:DMT family transporter [Pseudomonadota bacterium]